MSTKKFSEINIDNSIVALDGTEIFVVTKDAESGALVAEDIFI